MNRRLISMVSVALVVSVAACANTQSSKLKEVQRVKAGNLEVVLLSATDALKEGKDSFVLEFHSTANQQLVDVGTVKVNATMPMAGMAPMIGDTTVKPSTSGRYDVATDLGMAGTWRVGVDWDGPAGKGTATLQGRVQ